MQPKNFYFGGGAAESIIHPIALVGMILAIILMWALPRKYAIVPFLLSMFLIPFPQTLIAGGLHFFVYRIVIIAGCLRLISTKLFQPGRLFNNRLDSLDRVLSVMILIETACFLTRFSFQASALINQTSFLLDFFGGYFVLRYLIQDEEDIRRTLKTFAVISTVIGLAMLNEAVRHQNIFGLLGGVPEAPAFREGWYRCQGPFRNPILAGAFSGFTLPLMVWLWKSEKQRLLAGAAVVGCTIIMFASASSTSYMAYGAGLIGICMWPLRKNMRVIRWGIVIGLIGLQIVMKAPVWYVITHFELLGGSSNYHRALLVDMFVRHFFDWWLIGTNQNGSWGWDMYDSANEFVAVGYNGGLVAFVCFIWAISMCFSRLGKLRKSLESDPKKEWLPWLLGASLLAHMTAFFGISYFDQTQIGWLSLLAMISAATAVTVAHSASDKVAESENIATFGVPLLRPRPANAAANAEFVNRPLARR